MEVKEYTGRVTRTAAWRASFIAQHGARCHYCNRTGTLEHGPGDRPWHVDHKHPIARGGADTEDNLTLACKRCNLTKNVQPYEDFKKFAKAAFWQPDGGLGEGELDAILRAWEWCISAPNERLWLITEKDDVGRNYSVVVAADRNEGPDDPGAGQLVKSYWTTDMYARGRTEGAANFLIAAHQIIPDLVAEIRQLRADLNNAQE